MKRLGKKKRALLAGISGLDVYERMVLLHHYHAIEAIESFATLLKIRARANDQKGSTRER